MKSFVFPLLLVFTAMNASAYAAEQAAPLKDKDRVVFLGDSITQQGAGPKGYVTLFGQMVKEKLPDKDIAVINAGISGHKVPDLQKRLDKDVLAKDPTVVVIYIGINDVWHTTSGRGTPADAYESGLKELIDRIHAKNARVLLVTPSVIGEKEGGENPLDGLLEQYAGISRKVAYETGVQLLDLHDDFRHYLEHHNSGGKSKGILTTDGVHLNEAGNRFVAEQMASALGVNDMKKQLLRHVVLFKFKDDVSKEQIQEVVDAFAALPGKIDTIVDFEHGTDVSVENKAAGFTHGFVVTFEDEAGRDVYLPHQAHLAFVKLVGPRIDNVLVFDYYAK